MSALELGAFGKAGYHLKNNSMLSTELSLPILTMISRPPERILYKVDDPDLKDILSRTLEFSNVTSVNQYFSMNLNADYIFPANEKLKMALLLRTHYALVKIEDSKKLNMLRYALGLGFIF
jgi:hypothetical protein